jgi:hypothetical protein
MVTTAQRNQHRIMHDGALEKGLSEMLIEKT